MVQLTIRIKDWSYSKEVPLPGITPPTPEICTLGEEQTVTCPDGSTIVTAKCQKDSVTGKNKWVVTGKTCPPLPPPTQEFKIVKILPEDQPSLPNANEGQTVKITATVICKKKDVITKLRETAYLYIDGALIDQKTTNIADGSVTFDWEATAIPLNIHTVCVLVQPSDACKGIGRDCKKITVSPVPLSAAEQLAAERESAREQRRLLEQARQRLREEIIEAPITVPTIPTVTIPSVPTVPTTPTVPATPTTTIPTAPETGFGSIEIIGLPIEITPVTPPIYVYLDDSLVGRIYELPKTVTNVPVGLHKVYAKYKDISTPQKSVYVSKDTKSTVTL